MSSLLTSTSSPPPPLLTSTSSSHLLFSSLRCFEDHLPMRSTCTVMRTTSTTTSTAQLIAWHTPSLYYTSHPIKVKNYFIDLYSHFFLRLVPNCVRHDATACILINNCITLSLNVNTAPVLPFFTRSYPALLCPFLPCPALLNPALISS
jgi:hypothetical protein